MGLRDAHYVRNVLVVDAGITSAPGWDASWCRCRTATRSRSRRWVASDLGVAPHTSEVSFDARPAVILSFYALPQADAVKMARRDRRARGRDARLAAGRRSLTKFWDQTELVKASQASLRDAILVGALLAILVIFIFLRNLRMTLVAAIIIPIAMAIAIFAIGQARQTLNLMSMGGLAVAVGLIIDDAIVVIENIARNHREHPEKSMRETVAFAMGQIGPAMAASTATTVVVFLPLALLTGVSGFFFRALALTLGLRADRVARARAVRCAHARDVARPAARQRRRACTASFRLCCTATSPRCAGRWRIAARSIRRPARCWS